MPIINYEKLSNGANFYKCDLHIHTSISKCYKDKGVSIEDIIKKAAEKEIELIALTDHNNICDFSEARKIAKKYDITVLQGIEVTCIGGERGIHILALFDDKITQEELLEFLTLIGIGTDKRGQENAITDCTIHEVLSEIKKLKGITIAAHADSSQGLIDDLKGNQRINVVTDKNLDCIEVLNKDNISFFDGNDPVYKRKIPCIQNSDAHSLDQIGQRFTKLKMDQPNIEGIRQAFLDPDSRVRFYHADAFMPYPKIIGIKVNGGFIDNQKIKFNPNLNCLIGGRGTGKSTIIELIRFCLDSLPELEEYRKRRLEMIESVLGKGEVEVVVESKDGSFYNIQRKIGEHSRVYDSDGDKLNISPNEIFGIVGFGETELEKISYDVFAQLSIIDNFAEGIHELISSEKSIIKELKTNRENILNNKKELFDLEEEYEEFNVLDAKLKMLTKFNFESRLQNQKYIESEKVIVNTIIQILDEVKRNIADNNISEYVNESFLEIKNKIDTESSPNKKTILSFFNHFSKLNDHLKKNKENNVIFLQNKSEQFSKLKITLEGRHIRQERKTIELFKDLESEGIEEAGQNYLYLQKRKSELSQINIKISTIKQNIIKYEEYRNDLLHQLKTSRKKIYQKRIDCIENISKHIGTNMTVELVEGGEKTDYTTKLKNLLYRSRVRGTIIETITNSISPYKLVNILKNKNKKELIRCSEISSNWADLIINYPFLHENAVALHEVLLPDLPVIKLLIGKEFRTLDKLSLGQKCTSLLSLAMIESNLPLIVDTPEEGLDNIYVFESLVTNLRTIKDQRQIILATHNPNIPVSGDSELIICMSSDGSKGWISAFGSIDDSTIKGKVQEILEGGKEAFLIRQKKYGY